uniref:BH3-interacting domain death agonist-like isoform X1 n=2 Tax=Pristiophorus japonicus TaxID=55135 RepID=UPI00398EB40B
MTGPAPGPHSNLCSRYSLAPKPRTLTPCSKIPAQGQRCVGFQQLQPRRVKVDQGACFTVGARCEQVSCAAERGGENFLHFRFPSSSESAGRGHCTPAIRGERREVVDMSLNVDASFDKQTQYILLRFLQEKKVENGTYKQEMQKLEKEVTKGSSFDDDIQTDGHCSQESVFPTTFDDLEEGNPAAEELYREIGAHLAQLGDRLDQSINRALVDEFIVENERIQSQADGTTIMSSIITRLTNQRIAVNRDMPQEKVILLLALMLCKKTVLERPQLLPRIFRTTVQYISSQLQNYIHQIGGWRNI